MQNVREIKRTRAQRRIFPHYSPLVREKFYLLFECTPCYAERCSLWPFVSQMATRGIKWEGALCAALNFSADNSNIVFELASIWVSGNGEERSLTGKVHRVKTHKWIEMAMGLNVVKVLDELCFSWAHPQQLEKIINNKIVCKSWLNESKVNNIIPEIKLCNRILVVISYISVPDHIPRVILVWNYHISTRSV